MLQYFHWLNRTGWGGSVSRTKVLSYQYLRTLLEAKKKKMFVCPQPTDRLLSSDPTTFFFTKSFFFIFSSKYHKILITYKSLNGFYCIQNLVLFCQTLQNVEQHHPHSPVSHSANLRLNSQTVHWDFFSTVQTMQD